MDAKLRKNGIPVKCETCKEQIDLGNLCSNCLYTCGDCCGC